MVHMTMNSIIRSVLTEYLHELAPVKSGEATMRTGDDGAAEAADFVVKIAGLRRVNQEVRRVASPIEMPEHMHQPGFRTATIHCADDVEDTARGLGAHDNVPFCARSRRTAATVMAILPASWTAAAMTTARAAPT